jgi:hypothetical protein
MPISRLSEEQYLAIERAAEFKSEFLNGEMFAMSGASMQHNRLQQNLSVELSVVCGKPVSPIIIRTIF